MRPTIRREVRAALIRATRKAAALLSDLTAHGYVFRTDLRLRPDASVTPVCISASAALSYYEAEGRSWERAAFIKARPCAGDLAAGRAVSAATCARSCGARYLDFATIQDTYDMRQRIRDHKGLHHRIAAPGHDMKLGQGGIREIEFFTQTRQLIAGGRDPDLRVRGTVDGLAALAAKGWIGRAVADELTDHYREHREIEHRIQMVNDAQTHTLPVAPDAFASGRASGGRIRSGRMGRGDRDAAGAGRDADGRVLRSRRGQRCRARPDARAVARNGGDGRGVARVSRAAIGPRPADLLAHPAADPLSRMTRATHPDEALRRFDSFLRGLPAGVQLFSLFEANPQLIDLIVDICGTAPGLSAYLARHPEVLDGVLGGGFFSVWPGVAGLRGGLDRAVQINLAASGRRL